MHGIDSNSIGNRLEISTPQPPIASRLLTPALLLALLLFPLEQRAPPHKPLHTSGSSVSPRAHRKDWPNIARAQARHTFLLRLTRALIQTSLAASFQLRTVACDNVCRPTRASATTSHVAMVNVTRGPSRCADVKCCSVPPPRSHAASQAVARESSCDADCADA